MIRRAICVGLLANEPKINSYVYIFVLYLNIFHQKPLGQFFLLLSRTWMFHAIIDIYFVYREIRVIFKIYDVLHETIEKKADLRKHCLTS